MWPGCYNLYSSAACPPGRRRNVLRAAIVGATGIVGQQFLVALQGHPWIKTTALAASERSAGRSYKEA
ncbi:MAG: hypothetical protein KAW95_00520, partial [Dehalococcoidia bacterium]|nr:hypothetical protein [Dehalococcoidia bacterium]